MKISLTRQSSAGFAGNTVFTTQCLQKAKLLPTSGCVDRSFIIIIIIALLGVIIDHHHHHHHYTPPSILFGQTLRSSRALVLFSGAARWRRLFNRPTMESVEVEEWRKWRMFRWNCKDGSREQRRQWSRSSRISCYIEDGNGRLDQDNSVCQRESE